MSNDVYVEVQCVYISVYEHVYLVCVTKCTCASVYVHVCLCVSSFDE
jgi:hypothetical protein